MTLEDNTVIEISEDFNENVATIMKDSLKITNQCVSKNDLEFGSVYVGELGMYLYTNIVSKNVSKAKIELYHNLKVGNDYIPVPLGVYNVDKAPRTSRYIDITAYDNMYKLDIDYDGTATEGYIYDILLYVASRTEIELAQTREEIEAMTNGNRYVFIKEREEYSTYRDIVSGLACEMMAFATMNRFGALEIRQFKKEPDLIIDQDKRSGTTVAEKTTNYDAIRMTINNVIYTRIATGLEEANRVLTIEPTPCIADGNSDTYVVETIQNMADELYTLIYSACEFKTINNPLIDLGDMVGITTNGNHICNALVMKMEYNNHASMSIKSLSASKTVSTAKSSYEKIVSGIAATTSTIETTINTYTNAREYIIGADKKRIIQINFTSTKKTNGMFNSTILLEAAGILTTAIIKLEIYYNKQLDTMFVPMQSLTDGKHIITIAYPITEIKENSVNFIEVYADIDDGNVTIAEQGIRAAVSASGLTGATVWDGNINIEETYNNIILDKIKIAKLKDSARSDTYEVSYSGINQKIKAITLSKISVAGIIENIGVDEVITTYTINTDRANEYSFNREFISTEQKYSLITDYEYSAVEQAAESGKMLKLEIETEKYNIESVELSNG